MTYPECRYAQIEKECLGIVFACENFHEYIYGAEIAKKLRGTTSKHVTDAFKSIMAIFGIPKIVFPDNAPQFSSGEFRSFAVLQLSVKTVKSRVRSE